MSQTGLPRLDEHLLELARATRLRYRTPAEIRAIPNGHWEAWLAADTVPWLQFSASSDCQECLKHIVKATRRRMEAL